MSKDKHKQHDRILHILYEKGKFSKFAINRSHCEQFHKDSDNRDLAKMIKLGIVTRGRSRKTNHYGCRTHRYSYLEINTSEG